MAEANVELVHFDQSCSSRLEEASSSRVHLESSSEGVARRRSHEPAQRIEIAEDPDAIEPAELQESPQSDEPSNTADNVALAPTSSAEETALEGCLGSIINFGSGYQEGIDLVLNNRFMLIFYILFLIFPSFACIIGAMNLFNCPLSGSIPLFILVIGMFGLSVIILRIWTSIIEIYFDKSGCWTCPPPVYLVFYHLISLLYIWEIIEYFFMVPETDILKPNYCDPKFYSQALVVNIVAGFIIAVIPFLYGVKTMVYLKMVLSKQQAEQQERLKQQRQVQQMQLAQQQMQQQIEQQPL